MKPVALIQHTEVGAPGSIPQLLQELRLNMSCGFAESPSGLWHH